VLAPTKPASLTVLIDTEWLRRHGFSQVTGEYRPGQHGDGFRVRALTATGRTGRRQVL